MPEPFSREEIARYSRHLLLPEVSLEGQARLKAGSVLVVGAGGLGSPAALYLAAAGVGKIGLADFDAVDVSNLQRQVLYETGDVGRPKVESARERLTALNPHVDVALFPERLTRENATGILEKFDVVLDGTDNFATRYLTNDACFLLGKPNVYGSIYRFEGQVSVFQPGKGPCYRCLFPSPPDPGLVPSCAEGGVLGVLPGVVGALQATEALKLLLGIGRSLAGRLLLYDALALAFREIALARDPGCPLCGDSPTITALVDYDALLRRGRRRCRPAPSSSRPRCTPGSRAAKPCSSSTCASRRRPRSRRFRGRSSSPWGRCPGGSATWSGRGPSSSTAARGRARRGPSSSSGRPDSVARTISPAGFSPGRATSTRA